MPEATLEFEHFSQITPEVLRENGIKGVMTDLDDTLVVHNYPTPDDAVKKWLSELKNAGVPVCIVSNNRRGRTMEFVRELGIGAFFNSFKPSYRALLKAINVMGISKDEAVFIGDQLFTDIKAANKAGIKSFLVKPIGNKGNWFVRLKRRYERRKGDLVK